MSSFQKNKTNKTPIHSRTSPLNTGESKVQSDQQINYEVEIAYVLQLTEHTSTLENPGEFFPQMFLIIYYLLFF